jgi:hypothetical protein
MEMKLKRAESVILLRHSHHPPAKAAVSKKITTQKVRLRWACFFLLFMGNR